MRLEIRANAPKDDPPTVPSISLLGVIGDFSIILEGVDITHSVKKLTLSLGQDDWTTAVLELEISDLDISADADVFLKPGDGQSRQSIDSINQKLQQLRIVEERKARGEV
jgi:hypothetical protein